LQYKWTSEEIKLLQEMRAQNKTNYEMAIILNRTPASISGKLSKLGLSRPVGSNQSYFGLPGSMTGKKHKKETLLKISERAKERLADKTKHPSWKGGVRLNHNGYVVIRMPDHPRALNGYIFEHILVMENILGRYLENGECVHHINEVRNDNRPDNLMLFKNNADHKKYHAFFKREEIIKCLTV
jgi:hypothetical protein